MSCKILAVVEDLFFYAKIQHAAQQAGIHVESISPADLRDRLAQEKASVVFLDLNHRSGKAIELLQAVKQDAATNAIPVVAFLSHVQGDLARAARAAGCDMVLARSALSQQLPQLVQKFPLEKD